MDDNGLNQVQLTNNSWFNENPSWSPDGKFIAYDSLTLTDIFIMNSDGSNQINITNSPKYNDKSPCYSSDGNKIAFCSDRNGD